MSMGLRFRERQSGFFQCQTAFILFTLSRTKKAKHVVIVYATLFSLSVYHCRNDAHISDSVVASKPDEIIVVGVGKTRQTWKAVDPVEGGPLQPEQAQAYFQEPCYHG